MRQMLTLYIVVGTQTVHTVNVLLKYLFVKYIFKVYCFVRLVPMESLRFFGNLAENSNTIVFVEFSLLLPKCLLLRITHEKVDKLETVFT